MNKFEFMTFITSSAILPYRVLVQPPAQSGSQQKRKQNDACHEDITGDESSSLSFDKIFLNLC